MRDAFGHLTRRSATCALNDRQSFATQIATPAMRHATEVRA